MNTSLIWIIIPLIISGLLVLISNRQKLICITGSLVAFLLGIFADTAIPGINNRYWHLVN